MKCLLFASLLALAGCWNGNGSNLDLGGVSIGRQMIELKEAREAGAMSVEEYEAVKHALVDAVVRSKPETKKAD